MRARGADVLHLPGARLVAIRTGGQRTHGTNINAHAAFFAFKVVFFIRHNGRDHATVLNAERGNVHAFAAHADAAIAKNAPRTVEVNHRRPLLLIAMRLDVNVLRLGGPVGKRHVLQFALAAGVTYRTIQRMVPQQHLDHALARLLDLVALSGDDHALADDRGAGSLQLWHLLDLHQAHATRALQRKIWVIAERRHFNADTLASFYKQSTRRGGDGLAVNREAYEFWCFRHWNSAFSFTLWTSVSSVVKVLKALNHRAHRGLREISMQRLAIALLLLASQTGTVFLPND